MEFFNGDNGLFSQAKLQELHDKFPPVDVAAAIAAAIVAVVFAAACCCTCLSQKYCRESYEKNCLPITCKTKYLP